MTTFTISTSDAVDGAERIEHHAVVTWDRLGEIAGRYLGKRQLVPVEGRLQTRSWDDDRERRHWRTEIVADRVEMLSGRRQGMFVRLPIWSARSFRRLPAAPAKGRSASAR